MQFKKDEIILIKDLIDKYKIVKIADIYYNNTGGKIIKVSETKNALSFIDTSAILGKVISNDGVDILDYLSKEGV